VPTRRPQLLSVSFDPDHDTPERLRSYGATYIGSDASNAFAHWDFAVPDKEVLPEMARFFNVGITTGPDETITHTLSTTWVGPMGRWYGLSRKRVDGAAGGFRCEGSGCRERLSEDIVRLE